MVEFPFQKQESLMERRRFFKAISAGVSGAAQVMHGRTAGKCFFSPLPVEPLPRRPLGRTGEKLSIIGLGGVVLADEPQETAHGLVREARAHGINYFDVAPSYGNAEDRMGPALAPFPRAVFLACKTLKRDKAGASEERHR